MSLIGLLCGTALLFVMLEHAELLVSLGLDGRWFYVVLLPLGVSAAAFLFGVLRSHATFTGKHHGAELELGGPVVAFALVVVGGFFLPGPDATFPVTVFVHGEGGRHDLVLRDRGHVTLDLGGDRRREAIGPKGEAYFPAVPRTFRGQPVPIGLDADGYRSAIGECELTGPSVDLPVRRAGGRITGHVRGRDQRPIPGALVHVAGLIDTTDAVGEFAVSIPGHLVEDDLSLLVTSSGCEPSRHRVVVGSNPLVVVLRCGSGGR
jgi:hypothetical protein